MGHLGLIVDSNTFDKRVHDLEQQRKTFDAVETEACNRIQRFTAKCSVANSVDISTGCRVPPSEWGSIA